MFINLNRENNLIEIFLFSFSILIKKFEINGIKNKVHKIDITTQ